MAYPQRLICRSATAATVIGRDMEVIRFDVDSHWGKGFDGESLTPWLTGAGSRRLEGTNISHENAEGMAYVGVRVEPTVRLGSVGTIEMSQLTTIVKHPGR